MSDSRNAPDNNPAQVRGDINRNQSDKRPGMDPAAAPLETDSEAGGAALSEKEVASARASQRDAEASTEKSDPAELSYGSAMRPMDPAARKGMPRRNLLFLAIIVVVLLILLALI